MIKKRWINCPKTIYNDDNHDHNRWKWYCDGQNLSFIDYHASKIQQTLLSNKHPINPCYGYLLYIPVQQIKKNKDYWGVDEWQVWQDKPKKKTLNHQNVSKMMILIIKFFQMKANQNWETKKQKTTDQNDLVWWI